MSKLVSIVLPVYNEADNIQPVYKDLAKMARAFKSYRFEFIFVNDGSTDSSFKMLMGLSAKDNRVAVIDFSRNFGHQLAITAGLDYSTGDAVITMDSDLQDPPQVCAKMLKKWQAGFEIVYAKRRRRSGDSLFKRLSAYLFYGLINKLSETNIPHNVGDFRLMDRKVVNEVVKFREHQRFLRGLVSYVGFKYAVVEYDRAARRRGKTAYPLKKMLHLAIDGISSFSTVPLKLISRLGYLVSLVSLAGIIYAICVRIIEPSRTVPGWAFISVSIFFIGGVQMVMLGILGNYIARIYTEAQNRPLYIVSGIYKGRKKK